MIWRKKPLSRAARIRKIGILRREWDPALRAGRYWRGAYYMIPKFNLWIKVCCGVALLGALSCLVIVFTRPRPILLVSFPDGTTVCSLPPLDPATGRILPRPSREAELCAMLAQRSGRGTDAENAEFAKVSQVEPADQDDAQAPPLSAPDGQVQTPQSTPSGVMDSETPSLPTPQSAPAQPVPSTPNPGGA